MTGIFLLSLSLSVMAHLAASSEYNVTDALSSLYYVKATYCDVWHVASWNCSVCKEYHPSLTGVLTEYDGIFDTFSFSGYDPVRDEIVVAFRGTVPSKIQNWIVDLSSKQIPYLTCDDVPLCMVHEGFFLAWELQKPGVMANFIALHSRFPTANIVVTGHSLGAALATWAAVNIIDNLTASGTPQADIPLTVYNFGSPRVGNLPFSIFVQKRLPEGKIFRVTHARDWVPHLPPMGLCIDPLNGSYVHVPHELWYNSSLATDEKHCADLGPNAWVCQEDLSCADTYDLFWEWKLVDHMMYLGLCTSCNVSPSGNPPSCPL